jgi:ABC-2 type transport system permease protein
VILLQVPTRILAFVGKELIEVVRRPGAIASLILGPFLILAIFGLGYAGTGRPLRTILVVTPGSGLPTEVNEYAALNTPGLELAEITTDAARAEAALVSGAVDMVIIAPSDAKAALREGRRSEIVVAWNLIDPVQETFATFYAERLEAEVNREIVERAAGEGQTYAVEAGQAAAARIPPDVVASPARVTTRNVSPTPPSVTAFYSPAVLALILQHMALSLVAISLIRERSTGIFELFRISPVSAAEIIAGKIVAFMLLCGVIAASTVALLVNVLHVPLLGDPAWLIGVTGLVILASLGLGLVVALVADSERQAVQLALLALLGSVFFSGLVISIEQFVPAVRVLAYALPVTHGIRLMQDLMLRGSTHAVWEVGALGAIAVVSLVGAWLLLRVRMRRA